MRYKQILYIGVIAFSFTSCQSNSSNNNGAGNSVAYQTAKTSLADQEKANPKAYLKVTDGTFKKNLLGEWVIQGNTTSNATVAKFKDVVLTVSYYSKTKTLLGTEDFKQYEYVSPGQSVPFKIKSSGYQGTAIIGIDIKTVSVAD